MKISRTKTYFFNFRFRNKVGENKDNYNLRFEGQLINKVECYKYSRLVVQKNEGIVEDVFSKVKYGWMKWRETTKVLHDKKVLIKMKEKFYIIQRSIYI